MFLLKNKTGNVKIYTIKKKTVILMVSSLPDEAASFFLLERLGYIKAGVLFLI